MRYEAILAPILLLSILVGCGEPETAYHKDSPASPELIEIAKAATQGRYHPDWQWVVRDGQDWLVGDPLSSGQPHPFGITADSWILYQRLPPTMAGGGPNVVISKKDHAVLGGFSTQ